MSSYLFPQHMIFRIFICILQLNGDRRLGWYRVLNCAECRLYLWLNKFAYLFFSLQRILPNAPTQPVSFLTTRQ